MAKYVLKLNTDSDGLLRPDSAEARQYLQPLLGPQAMGTLATLYRLVDTNGGLIEPDTGELAGRLGISEKRVPATLDRLEGFGIIELVDEIDDTVDVTINGWVDPPKRSWREQHYPEALKEEFDLFVGAIEREQRLLEQAVGGDSRAVGSTVGMLL